MLKAPSPSSWYLRKVRNHRARIVPGCGHFSTSLPLWTSTFLVKKPDWISGEETYCTLLAKTILIGNISRVYSLLTIHLPASACLLAKSLILKSRWIDFMFSFVGAEGGRRGKRVIVTCVPVLYLAGCCRRNESHTSARIPAIIMKIQTKVCGRFYLFLVLFQSYFHFARFRAAVFL